MEYRGYDSAGVAVSSGEDIKCIKSKGRVALLKQECGKEVVKGTLGVGHTRWATHGEPSEKNAHPHTDCDHDFFVVHNGVIENYQVLKDRLIEAGHTFVSQTDTEVIAHLIEEYYEGDFKEAFRSALNDMRGALGIAVVSKRHPGELLAARFGSPLILGFGKDEYVIASDVTAILPTTNSVVYMNDRDLIAFKDGRYEISDFKNGIVSGKRQATTIKWDHKDAELGGYTHFMLKEIFEQPEALENTMRGRLVPSEGTVKFGGLEAIENRLRAINKLTITGMGTARLSGVISEYAFEELARIPTKVEYGSEFTYRSAAVDENTGLIAISQSGETADTINAVKEAHRKGMLTLGVVNVIGSSLSREVDAGIYNHVGPEIAVASTKASTSQVLLLAMLAVYLGRMRGLSKSEGQEIIKAMQRLPSQVKQCLNNAPSIEAMARKYKNSNSFLFLGRKYNTGAAIEGALKLKECANVHAEGINSTELKHGPLSLIDANLPSLVIAPNDSMYEKNKTCIQEIKARSGTVIVITTEGNEEIRTISDDVIYIPSTLEMLFPILAFIPMQLFAYYMAIERGNDVDKPRNLAKSVTVE